MNKTHLTGIPPNSEIVSLSSKAPCVLVRSQLGKKTKRYQAVYTDNLEFLYFREITTTERKNLAKGLKPFRPLSKITWKLHETWDDQFYWEGALPTGARVETTPLDYKECPEECATYILEGEIISRKELEDWVEKE
jgi:hypothetical protein